MIVLQMRVAGNIWATVSDDLEYPEVFSTREEAEREIDSVVGWTGFSAERDNWRVANLTEAEAIASI